MTPETVWVSLGIVLIFIEVMTGSLWIGFFGVGAVITAAGVLFGLTETLNSQIALFFVASTLSLFGLRKSVKQWLFRKSQPTTFGNSIGKQAVVVQEIPVNGSGRIDFQGSTWDAESEDGTAILSDSKVKITRQDGIRLFVKEI